MARRLRILTANLFAGRADPRAFAAQVESCGADVVACQELGRAQADALARVLPHGELDPDADGFRGMGIALRAPAHLGRLRSATGTPGSPGWSPPTGPGWQRRWRS